MRRSTPPPFTVTLGIRVHPDNEEKEEGALSSLSSLGLRQEVGHPPPCHMYTYVGELTNFYQEKK